MAATVIALGIALAAWWVIDQVRVRAQMRRSREAVELLNQCGWSWYYTRSPDGRGCCCCVLGEVRE